MGTPFAAPSGASGRNPKTKQPRILSGTWRQSDQFPILIGRNGDATAHGPRSSDEHWELIIGQIFHVSLMLHGSIAGRYKESAVATPLVAQPRLGKTQVAAHGVDGAAKDLGCFFRRHPAEIPHLNELRQRFVFLSEDVDSTI